MMIFVLPNPLLSIFDNKNLIISIFKLSEASFLSIK
ncbi:Uncharacterised protein [Proteus penneri]|nr:Uncharacterised protein [Proteus penneri]